MADPDEQVAFLSELFPDLAIELIFNSLLQNNCDIDEAIKSLLDPVDHVDQNPFDYLISTFPDVEIEAIEAFLLTHEGEDEDFDGIEDDFMKQFALSTGSPRKARDRDGDLKMKLSDFSALLKTSRDIQQTNQKNSWQPFRRNSTSTDSYNFTCKQNCHYSQSYSF